jgi:ABC-2 type transport system permease protein
MVAVYTVAFSVVLRIGSGDRDHTGYAVSLMAAFLPWTFLSTSVQFGATSLLANAGLISKVYFPREVLPLSLTSANLVNMGLAFAFLVPFAAWTVGLDALALLAAIPVTVGLYLFVVGLVLLASILTVFFRDLEFLLTIGLTAWFFLTPVVYEASFYGNAPDWVGDVLRFNPAYPFVEAYRDIFYRVEPPSLVRVVACLAVGAVTCLASYALFNRLKRNIAEEL